MPHGREEAPRPRAAGGGAAARATRQWGGGCARIHESKEGTADCGGGPYGEVGQWPCELRGAAGNDRSAKSRLRTRTVEGAIEKNHQGSTGKRDEADRCFVGQRGKRFAGGWGLWMFGDCGSSQEGIGVFATKSERHAPGFHQGWPTKRREEKKKETKKKRRRRRRNGDGSRRTRRIQVIEGRQLLAGLVGHTQERNSAESSVPPLAGSYQGSLLIAIWMVSTGHSWDRRLPAAQTQN